MSQFEQMPTPRRREAEHTQQLEHEVVSPAVRAQMSDVDDILAEIDDVLETNAQEFVNAFVQKGGE